MTANIYRTGEQMLSHVTITRIETILNFEMIIEYEENGEAKEMMIDPADNSVVIEFV